MGGEEREGLNKDKCKRKSKCQEVKNPNCFNIKNKDLNTIPLPQKQSQSL